MKAFEISGYWWPSDAPYDKVPGILRFDPISDLSLEVMGRFRSYTKTVPHSEHRIDIDRIFGRTVNGGEITLTQCQIGKYRVPPEYKHQGRGITRYHPEYCFAGEHSQRGPQFNSVNIQLNNFDDWIHLSNIEDLSYSLNTETDIDISYTSPLVQESHLQTHSEDDFRIQFSFDSPKDFKSVQSDVLRPFQFFITFGLRVPVFPLQIFGTTERANTGPFQGRSADGREIDAFSTVGTSVVYPEPRQRLRQEGRTHPIWTLAFIEDEVDEILRKWYSTYQKHRPLFDLFFNSMYYDDREYPSVTVLNLTRGLESYHRESERYDNRYINKEKFNEYREELENTIHDNFPDSFSDHLKFGTFRYANRVSLRKRLKDIIEDHTGVLKYRLRDGIDSDKMAKEIKDTRNDLTHLSDEDISEYDAEVEGSVLYKLKILIETIIADEVGFEPEIFPFYRKRQRKED